MERKADEFWISENAIHYVGIYISGRGMRKGFGNAANDFKFETLPEP